MPWGLLVFYWMSHGFMKGNQIVTAMISFTATNRKIYQVSLIIWSYSEKLGNRYIAWGDYSRIHFKRDGGMISLAAINLHLPQIHIICDNIKWTICLLQITSKAAYSGIRRRWIIKVGNPKHLIKFPAISFV